MNKTSAAAAATTLILGGNGKTGRRVAERLQARNIPVRIASRSANPAFDWNDPTTYAANVQGIRNVYLSYYPDLAMPGAADQIRAFAKVAVANGVKRIVLLSGRGEPQAHAGERAVKESGIAEYTILRAAWFAQNFSEGHFVPGVLAGEIGLPSADVKEPFIDIDDIADVAVLMLTTSDHNGKTYDLTGPSLVTFNEAVAAISQASKREIRYRAMPPTEFTAMLSEHMQMPTAEATFLTDLFRGLMDGHNAHISPDVERLLGRRATDFQTYVKKAAQSGVWA
jgi:uncharacterized protein YbjT (DUF2867 family)